MVWRRLWPLIWTAILLGFIQKSACFRIRYEPDVKNEENQNVISTSDETQTTSENYESSEVPLEDSNDGTKKEPESNSINQLENSEPESVPKNGAKTKNKSSVKQSPEELLKGLKSPGEVLKGFGRNPAIRKLVESEDPQLYERIASYVKTSQPDIPVNLPPESVDSQKSKMDIESEKSKAEIEKLTKPESTNQVITTETNVKLPVGASIIEAPKQLPDQKVKSFIDAENALAAEPLDETSKYLNASGLAQMTQSTGKGQAQSIECDIPHLDIHSRCFANIMEVTVTSRNALLGRISFQEAEGHMDITGNTASFYAIYGIKTTSGFMWRLQKGVTIDDVDVDCKSCHSLELRMMVLIMEDIEDKNKRCVVDLTCTQPNMPDQPKLGSSPNTQNEISKDVIISESATSRVHSAKTTLNILKGTSMESEVLPQDHFAVELGTQLSLTISAYTKEITLDLHILNCEARGEDGKGITLIKDGCSAHHMMGEFHEVLGVVHDPDIDDHHVVRVTQHTTFQVFNFSPKPQTIAIICKIKMCGGECDERPGCVNSEVNLGHRKAKSFTIFYEEVVLGQMLNVAALPEIQGSSTNLDLLSNIIEPEEEAFLSVKEGEEQILDLHADCVPRTIFYISLGVLGGLFLLLLVMALYFSKSVVLPRMSYKTHMDEIESPNRAYYQEYSSPRRRSPGSKSPEQAMLNKIVYS